MEFKVEIKETISESDWNDSLLRSKDSFSVQTVNNFFALKDGYNSQPIFIEVLNKNNEIVGQLAVSIDIDFFWADSNTIISKFAKIFSIGKNIRWEYGPIIFDKKNYYEIFELMIKTLITIGKNNKVSLVYGTFPPLAISNSYNFKNFKKNLKDWSTIIVNTNSTIEEYYSSLNKKTRYDIRKSENTGLKFSVTSDLESLNLYAKLKILSKKQSKLPILKNQVFPNSRFNFLHKNGLEKLFLVHHNDELLGGLLVGIFNGNAIEISTTILSKKELLPGVFLTWNVLKWCHENGIKSFDFGGVNPNPKSEKELSIFKFKSKWGGNQVNYKILSVILNSSNYSLSRLLKFCNKF